MSDAQIRFPPNRLAAAISNASPTAIQACVAQAQANLKAVAGACADHVDHELGVLENNLRGWPERPEDGYLASLYEPSVSLIGAASVAGFPHLDQAARSLCDVIDGLWTNSAWEKDPIAVHVAAMRLLRRPEALGEAAAQVLDGLHKVRQKYVAA